MASFSDSFSPLQASGASLRAHSYSAVESYLSADSSFSSTSASSSSTSTIASSSSSTSTLTPPEPVSPNKSRGSGIPLWKTLVRPRRWRFVQRSRIGGSLDRERARQEDASLDGDQFTDSGSCVDVGEENVFTSSEKLSSQPSGGGTGMNGVGSSVDRTKSESDIGPRKATGERRPLGFKTRAERFSLQDNQASSSQPRPSAMTRSQTLPPTGRSTLSPARTQTLPRGPTLVDSSRRSRSSGRMDGGGHKTVTFSEPEKVELSSPAKSDSSSSSSDKGSDKSVDSPSRSVTLNVEDSTVRVSFSKPAVPAKPLVLEKPRASGSASVKHRPAWEKPEVPAKPARLSATTNGPTAVSTQAASSPTANPATASVTKGSTRRTSSSSSKSPSSPVDETMEFTIVDGAHKDSQSEPTKNKSQLSPEFKPKTGVRKDEKPSEDSSNFNQLNYDVKTQKVTLKPQREDINDNVKESSEVLKVIDDVAEGRNEESEAETEVPSPQHSPVRETTTPDTVEANKKSAKAKDIAPKKMMKIKGDKKAEEKAAKAKKKEQKAKEKEQKSKKTSSDTPDQEKGRIKLFPWRVEFSAKDKSHTADTISSALKSKDSKLKKGFRKGRSSGKEMAPSPVSPAGAKDGVLPTAQSGGAEDPTSAPAKKTDKSDAAGSSSSKNSSSKKDAATAHPLQEEEDDDEQDGQVEMLQQPSHAPLQRQQRLDSTQDPTTRQTSPSPPPPHIHQHSQQQQRQHHHQQHQHHHQQHQQHQHHHQQQHHHHHHHQQQQCLQQPPPRQPTPKPRYFDDVSSSDQNSDLDSWYGSLPRRHLGGKCVRIYESDGETVPLGPPGQHGGRRKALPRRHTVGGAQIQEHLLLVEDTNRKREAFYEMLASRYPQYADKITGLSAYPNQSIPTEVERSSRPREVVRRRTTVPAVSHYASRSLDYDDPGTMSDIELSSFQRGGYARASMPIVRSASTSLERPIGLVFLVYRDETKKALLPNEITSLDTVRALFVRAFPEKLSMEFLDSPRRKIYILEATTSIFFQLEDLKDIKDRTVLKIHECDSDEPQHVKCPIEIRGRTAQPVRPSILQGFLTDGGPHFPDEVVKAQSLPVSSAHTTYQEQLHKERMQWEMEQKYLHDQLQRRSRSRSLTPEPAERPRSLSTGPPRGRYSHSPDSLPTPERGPGPAHLNPIPENPRLLANGFRQSTAATNGGSHHYNAMGGHPHGGHHPTPVTHPPLHHAAPPILPGRVLSPPPPVIYDSVYPPGSYTSPHSLPQAFVSHSTRAPAPQGPLRATGPPQPPPHDMRGHNQGGPPHRQSLPFAAMSNPVYDNFPPRSQPYRVTPERDVLPPRPHSATPHEAGRMERMEAQIASLAAWVHQAQASPPVDRPPPPARRNSNRSTSSGHSEGTDTYPPSTASSLSDIPTSCSEAQQPVVTPDMREKINDVRCRMQELRVELQGLRRMEQLNQEAMKDAFTDTLSKLKKVIGAVPGADDQVVRQQRLEVNSVAEAYRQDKARVEKELSDLELSVEELKQDVLARRCRINITDVEGLALVLSNITKVLADLKGRFPKVHESLRKVMAGEIEIVVKEEKFIKEEPQQIEAALKRCKKLTSTLYTLKRLATVQDTRPLQVPSLALDSKEVGDDEKMAILESIRAMVPDHDTRLYSMEAADASRERKKKIVTQQESMKFTKSLQTASKSLRPPEPQTITTTQHKEDAALCTEKDASRKSTDSSNAKKSEHPAIPAKPARLMLLTSEPKHTDAVSASSSSSLVPQVMHTVTVTSQISGDREKKETENKSGGSGSSARSVFFSSMESSPPLMSASIEKSPMVTVSAATSLATCSVMKPVAATHYQATLSRSSASSSGPHLASRLEDREETMNDRGKRVPPLPPPRKSSARYPYGIGPLSPQSPAEHSAGGGGGPSLQRQNSGERSPDKAKGLTVYKAHSPTSTTMSGPLSSTPKPPTPQKPPNLTKLLRTGSSPAGMTGGARRPHLQYQRVGRGGMFTTFVPPVPAEVVTNSQDPLDEGDLSGSESTGSTTSLDSQKGANTLVRANSTPHGRGPRPFPPQRCSSLKEGSPCHQQGAGVRAHVLEVKKPLRVGTMTVQVNGLDRAAGHKT